MGIAEDYRRQWHWRDWETAFDALPALAGQSVLDLGCGPGDQSAELVRRGARVVGYDLNEELLAVARARSLPGASFECADLRALPEAACEADGIWCSFAAAYMVDLEPVLRDWHARLRPGGWIALIEVDDLLAHEPVGDGTRALLDAYARDAVEAGRYDFRMGARLRSCLQRAGFVVTDERSLADRELAFEGAASPEVAEAWAARLERMRTLQELCGSAFTALRTDFLGCLSAPEHRSRCRVVLCLARRPPA